MRLCPRLPFVRPFVCAALLGALLGVNAACALGCMQATQTYALVLHSSPLARPRAGFDPQDAVQSGPRGADVAGGPDAQADSSSLARQRARFDRSAASGMVGSLSVERIEGGQHLVVLQLEQLPPPERIAPGLREFVVWLEDPRGGEVNVGTLRYDRANHSGNLLATTDLSAFTVRVTGERDARAAEPAGVLLAERRVVTN